MGSKRGIVILQHWCERFAPAMGAASYGVAWISCSAARNVIMEVGAVVKIFWNMIAIQAMLGPRKYHCVDGISPPNAWTTNWIKPRGSPSQSIFLHSTPKIPRKLEIK